MGSTAPLLCGWIDFSDTEVETGFGFENDADERVCVAVTDPNPSTAGDPCDATATTGEFNCTLGFVIPADWNGDNGDPGGTDDAFLSRFRVTTDWASAAQSDFNGFASDGEVEDYLITAETLPVSIHSFSTRQTSQGLVVEWGTASETRNAGFAIWGDAGNGLELLTQDFIPSTVDDAVRPRVYERLLAGVRAEDYDTLFISAVDISGKERIYGAFEPEVRYGRQIAPAEIPWRRINLQAEQRLAEIEAIRALDSQRAASAPAIEAVDVTASGAGMHEVSHAQLRDAGLDLTGVAAERIAVTLKGKPVARQIVGGDTFGPGSWIRFWAEAPSLPDALYVENFSYRIADDPAQALEAESLVGAFSGFVSSFESPAPARDPDGYSARQVEARDNSYHFGNPSPDPWFMARLRADQVNDHTVAFELDGAAVPEQGATLRVRIAGLSDFPESPDHRIRIDVNGQTVEQRDFEGLSVQVIDLDLPAGILQAGANQVRVIAPGGTQAQFDVSVLDSIELAYRRRMIAENGRLVMTDRPPRPASDLMVSGFSGGPVVGFAYTNGNLVELGVETIADDRIRVDSLEQSADYWISTPDALKPVTAVRGVAAQDLLAGADSDFVIIASPEFLPASADEDHPLNRYLEERRNQGWNPAVFSVADIQRRFGWGMPLPEAVTRFLAAASETMTYEHVLLVGGDSYDYLDHLGLGSRSFIPTLYRPGRFITHAPADPLLADLDGDGVSDKALGRWPVRSLADLEAIVTKTLDWSGDPAALANAVWVTDSQDPSQPSFVAQAEALSDSLRAGGWLGPEITGVYFDQVVPDSGLSVADTARQQFFDRLEQGRSLSGFIGHGSPSAWTFQGMLTPDDIGGLFNEGSPTLIGTMTCYTTYFVSPYSDTVAHRWMNGYREDAQGNPIPGVPNGAVAVHGAAVLSTYATNGWFARSVLDRQLAGQTLGQAIEATRSALSPGADQVFNWILLGDPTLRLN